MAYLHGDAPASAIGTAQPGQVQFDLFEAERWPRHPYCTDDFESGVYPRSLFHAMKKRYIQPNPPYLRVWSVHDIDRPDAALAWEDAMLPPPNWTAVNLENGHAHIVYGLSAPVLVSCAEMRQKPLRYLCAVEHAYREVLGADAGYSGLLTKNPTHQLWRTLKGPNKFYDLKYLSEFVDLSKFTYRKKPEEIGLGRNVVCFDFLRNWAYKNIREYKYSGVHGFKEWLKACNHKAQFRNGDFPLPLDPREIQHIAKSVANWTWERFDIAASDKRFSALQAHRGGIGGKKSGEARLFINEDKRSTAQIMSAKGLSSRAIANELGVDQSTVVRWVKR